MLTSRKQAHGAALRQGWQVARMGSCHDVCGAAPVPQGGRAGPRNERLPCKGALRPGRLKAALALRLHRPTDASCKAATPFLGPAPPAARVVAACVRWACLPRPAPPPPAQAAPCSAPHEVPTLSAASSPLPMYSTAHRRKGRPGGRRQVSRAQRCGWVGGSGAPAALRAAAGGPPGHTQPPHLARKQHQQPAMLPASAASPQHAQLDCSMTKP